MRRQPQVSGPARHWPAVARAGRGPGTWGVLQEDGPTGCRTGGDSWEGGLWAHPTPRAACLSPLLRVSAERRPQEAAPREAAADRRAQRQTSKRAGARAHPPSRGGGGVAGHLGCTRRSADLGAARSHSRRTPCATLKVTRAPFSGKKELGSRRPRGESAVAERQKLHLKGGEQPGVHFELVDMFLECGHFPGFGVGTPRWCEAGGGGSRGRWFGLDTQLLGSGLWVPLHFRFTEQCPGAPRPALVQPQF